MLHAIKEFSESTKPVSFLSIIDHGRALFNTEAGHCEKEDLMIGHEHHFLKLIHDFHLQCRKEGKYILAEEFMEHEQRLIKDEEIRKINLVKCKHSEDRQQLAIEHDRQEGEFQRCEYYVYQDVVVMEVVNQSHLRSLTFIL